MAGMWIKRPVAYVVLVTPEFRQEMEQELTAAADQIQSQLEQIEFQARRYLADLQRTNLSQAMAVRDQIDAEKKKQEKVREEILARMEEIKKLPDGAEFVRGTFEGAVEVAVGNDLTQVLAGAAIVVRDNVVVEIREGIKPEAEPQG
jgi:hypothetical protein